MDRPIGGLSGGCDQYNVPIWVGCFAARDRTRPERCHDMATIGWFPINPYLGFCVLRKNGRSGGVNQLRMLKAG